MNLTASKGTLPPQSNTTLKSQLYQYTKNKLTSQTQSARSGKFPIESLNTNNLQAKQISSILRIKTESKPGTLENSLAKTGKVATPSRGAKTPRPWPVETGPYRALESMRESTSNYSAAAREAFWERKLAEKRQIFNGKEGSIDQCLSSRVEVPKETRGNNVSKEPVNKERNNGQKPPQPKIVTEPRSPLNQSLQVSNKGKVGSPAAGLRKCSSKKEFSVGGEKEKLQSPRKHLSMASSSFMKHMKAAKQQAQQQQPQQQQQQKEKESGFVKERRRSKSVLLEKSGSVEKYQGISIETDFDRQNDDRILSVTMKDESFFGGGENALRKVRSEGRPEEEKEKEKEQKGIEMESIKLLQQEIVQLKEHLKKIEENTRAEIEMSPKMSPKSNHGAYTFTLNNLPTTSPEADLKQKEIDIQKMQIDTLNMTIEFLKNENLLLKDAQKKMQQYKEAAKKYREIAQTKAEECAALGEELAKLKKNPIRRTSEKLSSFSPSHADSQRKSGFLAKFVHEQSAFKSLGNLSIDSITDIVAKEDNEVTTRGLFTEENIANHSDQMLSIGTLNEREERY